MFKKLFKNLAVTHRVALRSCLLLALFAQNSHANDPYTDDSGAWLQAVAEGSAGVIAPSLNKTRIWLEGQSRFNGDFDHWYQGMVRAALGYSISDRATIWAGYTYLPTQNLLTTGKDAGTNGPYLAQQDVWPAFRYILPTNGYGTFMFRTMWESNFVSGSQVRERPRQMIKWNLPVGFDNKLSLIAWDEVFVRVNDTNWGGKAGFDQNRAFGGLGWTFNPTIRTELGYMNQYIDDKNHVNTIMHHLLMASVFVNF